MQGKAKATDQVLCDLVHFFACVLKCYHPAVAADLVPAALVPPAGSVVVQATPFAKELAASNRYFTLAQVCLWLPLRSNEFTRYQVDRIEPEAFYKPSLISSPDIS